VSSTATKIAAPGSVSRSAISAARRNPSSSEDQRAWLKKRCARQ
jgi:hypothetical protein